jgi:hypothetical protein
MNSVFFKKKISVKSLIICVNILFALPQISIAQGSLLINPNRVVFDGSSRSIDLNLANSGQDSATYSISLVQIRMTEEGGFERITEPDPGQRFADKFIRFYPRSVTLAPKEAQVVKVQVARRSQLEDGEYRSHFYFRSEKAATPLGEDDPAVDDNNISVRLTPVFGITIPVIIRIGDFRAEVNLTDLSLDNDEGKAPVLNISFNREGEISAYGNLIVDHISPSGLKTRVGIANGLAVYTPNTTRKFRLNLFNTDNIDLSKGKLIVTFSSSSDLDPEVYDELEFILGKESA